MISPLLLLPSFSSYPLTACLVYFVDLVQNTKSTKYKKYKVQNTKKYKVQKYKVQNTKSNPSLGYLEFRLTVFQQVS